MSRETGSFAREVGQEIGPRELPPYAESLAAYHRAHAAEIRRMIADLPLRPGDCILDLACGDGLYTRLLAERAGPAGRVVGVDIAPAYLERAWAAVYGSPLMDRIEFRQADAARLPFADESFDLAWCAQSMFSLPDPQAAMSELRRVVRRGGIVAVFENDTLHQLVLPWPAELELAVRKAQLAALAEGAAEPAKFFIGRNMRAIFAEVGLKKFRLVPYTSVRQAPLSPDELLFLEGYLGDLRARAAPFLDPATRAELDALTDPNAEGYLPRRDDFVAIYLDLVAVARR